VPDIVGRLSIKARAAGIFLIFAAQRPEKDVMPMQLRSQLRNRLILKVDNAATSEIALARRMAARSACSVTVICSRRQAKRLIPFTSRYHLWTLKNTVPSWFNSLAALTRGMWHDPLPYDLPRQQRDDQTLPTRN
jgi:hypothetical protein